MGFGIDSGISRQTNNSVQVAEKVGTDGTIIDMTTYGGAEEKTEEAYADSITNEAVNSQTGTAVVTSHNFIESNTEYARAQKTTRTALPTTTTTTTTT